MVIDSVPFKEIIATNVHSIAIIHKRIYVGALKGVFYKDIDDSIWHIMNTPKEIKSIKSTVQIIEFQNKILCKTDFGIPISYDGNSFTELYDPIVPSPDSLRGHGGILSIANNKLYICSYDDILSTSNLHFWERVSFDKGAPNLLTAIGCSGVIIKGLRGLYYSFDEKNWNEIPRFSFIIPTSPISLCVFNKKIFTSLIGNDITGIYSINFNYQLKF
jgi:hypothetical protein